MLTRTRHIRTGRWLLLGGGLLLGLTAAASVAAPPAEVVKISFTGNHHLSDDRLRTEMKTREASFLRGAAFDADVFADDLRALRELYQQYGFLEAQVAGEMEEVDTRTLPHKLKANIKIEEGARTLVGSVRFRGNQFFSTPELEKVTRLRAGDPFAPREAERDRYRVMGTYLDEGFMDVQVVSEITEGPDERDLSFTIQEGDRFHLGKIAVEGNAITKEHLIRRELTMVPGDILRRASVLESEKNVYDTGLFTMVDMVPVPSDSAVGVVDLVVRVREQDSRWFSAGIGYGTLDELRLSGDWENRNLGGHGSRLSSELLFATELSPRQTRRVRAEVGLAQPWLVGKQSVGGVSPFFEQRLADYRQEAVLVGTYRLRSVGVSANLRRDFGERTRFWLRYTHEWLRLRSVTFDITEADREVLGFDSEGRAEEASFTVTMEHDGRDAVVNPTRGTHLRLLGEITAGRPGGFDNPFAKWTVSRSWYHPVGSRQTLTWRMAWGGIAKFARGMTIPDRSRFMIGGETSLRGYQDREIGPGNHMFTTSLEYLFPLRSSIRGLVFVDGGGVWGQADDFSLSQFTSLDEVDSFRYAIGLGLRIVTPIGPIRVGYAQQVRPRISFAYGRPFVLVGQGF